MRAMAVLTPVRLLALWAPLGLALGLGGACEPPETDHTPSTVQPSSGGPPDAGGSGGGGAEGGSGAGGAADSGVASVLVGLDPNPRYTGEAGPSADELLQAELEALAIGTRVVVLVEPWRALDAQGVEPLAAKVAEQRARGLAVVLDLMVANRRADQRPTDLAELGWNDPGALDRMDQTLADILGSVGTELHAVVLGRELDQYSEEHPDEKEALAEMLVAAMGRIDSLSGGSLPSGVGLSFSGGGPSATTQQLAGVGRLLVFSYLPGLGKPTLPSSVAPGSDLDAMIALAGARPVLLERVGLSTAADLGGSNEQQDEFLSGLFEAVAVRRSKVRLLNVVELHDRSAADCAALASAQEEPVPGDVSSYLCGMGLRDSADTPKPAWYRLVTGAAAFASP